MSRRDAKEVVFTDTLAVAPVQSTAPLRVCIVAPSLDIVGGQAVVAQRLIARLAVEGDLRVSFLPHNPRLPGVLRGLQRVRYVRTAVTFVAYIASLLRELPRYDVVHIFSASYWSFLLAPAPAIVIGRLYGKRVILNYRSGEAADHLARWRRIVLPIMRRASAIVVPSGYLVAIFARFGLAARPIFNFVDTDSVPFRDRRVLRPHFLSNRNFAPHYNVGCTLRAFQIIQRVHPDARLVVAGDGEERQLLHSLARDLELQHVEFVGQVSPERMTTLYDAADIYLNTPNVDNMPNSVIEAFAAGLPVVSTSAGGIPYIVTDRETGLLVNLDDHRAVAEHALALLRTPMRGYAMAERARREVLAKYSWSSVQGAWRDVYASRS